MKKILTIVGCITLLNLTSAAEEVARYDHRQTSTDEGLYALFCSKPAEDGIGDAIVVLVKGKDLEAAAHVKAFGLLQTDSGPTVGEIPADKVNDVRAAEPTKTLAVRLDAEQFAVSEALMAEWCGRNDFADDADVVTLNFCDTLVLRLKMKKPFRPVLSRADPHVYFDDLTKLNRNKVIE